MLINCLVPIKMPVIRLGGPTAGCIVRVCPLFFRILVRTPILIAPQCALVSITVPSNAVLGFSELKLQRLADVLVCAVQSSNE